MADDRLPVPLREDPRPVGPREEDVVPLRQEADGHGSLGVGDRRSLHVEELAALLVAEASERLEPLEGAIDLGHVHHRPGADVTTRGRSESREVAAEDLRAGLGRIVELGLLERDEPPFGSPAPERGLVVMDDVGTHARGAPRAASVDAREPVLALEMHECFLRRHGTVGGERTHRRCEALQRPVTANRSSSR